MGVFYLSPQLCLRTSRKQHRRKSEVESTPDLGHTSEWKRQSSNRGKAPQCFVLCPFFLQD